MKATQAVCLDDGLVAISSLPRALRGAVRLPDVGSLMWVLVRQIVPADAMALFFVDATRTNVVARYAAGDRTDAIVGASRPMSVGAAGWVAVNRVPILNAEPLLDLGIRAAAPALRSSLVVPLVHDGALVAVLSLYSKDLLAFTDDHVCLLNLLRPYLAESLVDAYIAEDETSAPAAPALKLVKRQTVA